MKLTKALLIASCVSVIGYHTAQCSERELDELQAQMVASDPDYKIDRKDPMAVEKARKHMEKKKKERAHDLEMSDLRAKMVSVDPNYKFDDKDPVAVEKARQYLEEKRKK